MFRRLLPLLFLLWCAPAYAQNPMCPTRPPGDSTNACASTAFVAEGFQPIISGLTPGLPLIGSSGGSIAQGTVGGTGSKFALIDGSTVASQCGVWDSSGGLISEVCPGGLASGVYGQTVYYTGTGTTTAAANQTNLTNLLPNTQWQIFSTLGGSTGSVVEPTPTGVGVNGSIAISGFTTSSTFPTLTTSNTQNLKANDIIGITGTGAGNLSYSPIRVYSVVPNTSFTLYMPGQLSTPASSVSTLTATSVVPGNYGTNTNGPDGWTKTSTLNLWRDTYPGNAAIGSKYSLGLVKGASGTENFTYVAPINQIPKLAGRTIVFGAYVLSRANAGTGNFQLCIITTCSAVTAGTGTYQWVEVSYHIPSSTTNIYFTFAEEGATNDVYYISNPMAAYGAYLGTGNYIQNPGEVINFINHINPPLFIGFADNFPSTPWPGTTTEFGWEWDLYALTYGQIADTVKSVQVQMEFTTPTVGVNVQESTCICSPGAIFGGEVASQVANNMNTTTSLWPLDTTGLYITGVSGYFALASGISGGIVSNLTFDFSSAILN
jgi:hypothetical protein